MTHITPSADCGNSPKNQLVENLAISLLTGEVDGDLLADDVEWRCDDGSTLTGRQAVLRRAADLKPPAKIVSERICSHGKIGAASGRAGKQGFAHFFEFASAAAKVVVRIESYSKTNR